jgi:hypothetical protein
MDRQEPGPRLVIYNFFKFCQFPCMATSREAKKRGWKNDWNLTRESKALHLSYTCFPSAVGGLVDDIVAFAT